MASSGRVLEHRAVVEQALGRFLYPCEQVHHKDRNRVNNELSNLQLYATQRAHLLSEHGNSRTGDGELVALVLSAARDPNKSFADLPCAPQTARRILRAHGVEWASKAEVHGLTEELVREALKTVPKEKLGAHFGCSYGTIWRRFPHLLVKRLKPGFLDPRKEEIFGLLLHGRTFRQIGERYNTSATVVSQSLLRWSTSGALPIAVVQNVNARPKCKLRL